MSTESDLRPFWLNRYPLTRVMIALPLVPIMILGEALKGLYHGFCDALADTGTLFRELWHTPTPC
ncbi:MULTISPECIES: hypothetical protein [Pseudomonas]|uniref:Uncharacterized protein n=2 Tax=Pseudomonas putida group TaxID=136845 RepID=A0ABX9B020_9PSED|nr:MULTISPECIES: hypothetical protein [Pseudomonas]WPE27935.1 hypothetical protein PshuTeo1_36620 [Pseudomonas hunanensis]MBH3413763.1 hypothetical protein [Pseudomonas putida]MBP2084181.1 hypothetical protein [Pseudomonas sp. PvP089]MBP2090117.1 hypothetical protein [Pseudomonas sp. PvP088]MBP2223719.1 hypothetical protein [Pseudomonas putida]